MKHGRQRHAFLRMAAILLKREGHKSFAGFKGGSTFMVGCLKIVAFLLKGNWQVEEQRRSEKKLFGECDILAGQRSAKGFVGLITFATRNYSGGYNCVEPDFSALLCKRVHFALWVCSALPSLRMSAFVVSFDLLFVVCALV